MFDRSWHERLVWRKSSKSGNSGCVEVASVGGRYVALRDSKIPDEEPFIYTPHEWRLFVSAIRAGEFDDLLPETDVGS